MKILLNLQSSFTNILHFKKKKERKIPIKSTKVYRVMINLPNPFLQTQSFFIIWNQKQMIFILGRTGSRERKLLKFKWSTKTFTQDTKAILNYKSPLQTSVISLHSILWYQLIRTKRSHWVAVCLHSPINYSTHTYTLLLTLQLCYKPPGIFQSLIKNK